MTTEKPVEDEIYEPDPYEVAEGSLFIADLYEFFERTGSIAAHVIEGVVWVLDAKTLQWRNSMTPPGDTAVVSIGGRKPRN